MGGWLWRCTAAAAAVVVSATLLAVPPAASVSAPPSYRGCPESAPAGTLREGSAAIGAATLCARAAAAAATPQARLAVQAAFHMLGAPYACGGVGRMAPFRFDCSSLVSRAYFLGAGLDTAGTDWAPSTRDMVPWDGVRLASWAKQVAPADVRPGDLVLYDTGGSTYRHVAMYLGSGFMLHTNSCGDVAHVTRFWGFGPTASRQFLVARRVAAPEGWTPPGAPAPKPPPPATPPFPGGTLGPGDMGPAVAAAQTALIAAGYLQPQRFGPITPGTFGSQTRDAVAAYQHAHPALGPVTGRVGLAMYRALTGWSPASTGVPPSSGPAEPRRPTVSTAAVRRGERAPVREVQAALNRVLGVGIAVDGAWGTRTQAAFTVFRRQIMGLTGSAATGPPTRTTLARLGRLAGMTVTD